MTSTRLSGTSLDTVPADGSIAGTADFNGDNKGEILWWNSRGVAVLWLMNGATLQR